MSGDTGDPYLKVQWAPYGFHPLFEVSIEEGGSIYLARLGKGLAGKGRLAPALKISHGDPWVETAICLVVFQER